MLDFLGIGAQKAGTTWVYEWLRAHPDVCFPGGKEIHFWDGKSAYDEAAYRALFQANDGRALGEITPAYAVLPVDQIRQVRVMAPGARLVYMIRNPIARAWSAARMALASAVMELDEASDQWFVDHFRSRGSLERGDYETCIRNWRSVFGSEPLLILRYETISSDPLGLLRMCCKHIGVDESWVESVREEEARRPVFAGTPAPIRPSILPILEDIYYPRIESLARYLDTDLGAWMKPANPPADRTLD